MTIDKGSVLEFFGVLVIASGTALLAVSSCGFIVEAVETQPQAQADAGLAWDAAADSMQPAIVDAAPDATLVPLPPAVLYAHSPSALYQLDLDTMQFSDPVPFVDCGTVVDIALDKDSNLYGTSFTGFYRIEISTGICTAIVSGISYPNSLSFVPAPPMSPTEELLVAYQGATYLQIDVSTGEMTELGALSGFTSSGDVVSVEGGATYLTANGSGCDDCLLEIDPRDGSLIKNWGSVGYTNVYGLGFWAGSAFGFDASGAAFRIDFGDETVTTPIDFPQAPTDLSFYGAGSTTKAPALPLP